MSLVAGLDIPPVEAAPVAAHPEGIAYRLVSFFVGRERYLILTNRLDLTPFQVILLYAYRWQVELIFRFLKRSLNGLHLLSQSQEGVTIHFYLGRL
ncbi:MAG: transposase [Armatimonadota bacterium]|nr:transposase [Armatimonadota bacterium]